MHPEKETTTHSGVDGQALRDGEGGFGAPSGTAARAYAAGVRREDRGPKSVFP